MEVGRHPFEKDAVPHGPDLLVPRDRQHGNLIKNSNCDICYTLFGKAVSHRHFSAKYHLNHLISRKKENMLCPTCKVGHRTENPNSRQIVLFGSSIIFEAYRNNLFRTPIHIEFELMCGGKIKDFTNLFEAYYADNAKPLDVFLCTGVNDVSDSTEKEIIQDFENFYKTVFESNGQNRCFILRIIRPPRLYNLVMKEECFVNSKEKIDKVNDYLKKRNLELGNACLPNLVHLGTHVTASGAVRHFFKNWRENSQGQKQCLHLVENYRSRICRKILQYIRIRVIGFESFDMKFPHEG